MGTLRALGLAIQGRAGHPGWMLQFSVASPAKVLSSPEWTWAGVGNAACASPGRQAAREAGRGSTGRAQRQLAGNFELGTTNG